MLDSHHRCWCTGPVGSASLVHTPSHCQGRRPPVGPPASQSSWVPHTEWLPPGGDSSPFHLWARWWSSSSSSWSLWQDWQEWSIQSPPQWVWVEQGFQVLRWWNIATLSWRNFQLLDLNGPCEVPGGDQWPVNGEVYDWWGVYSTLYKYKHDPIQKLLWQISFNRFISFKSFYFDLSTGKGHLMCTCTHHPNPNLYSVIFIQINNWTYNLKSSRTPVCRTAKWRKLTFSCESLPSFHYVTVNTQPV